MTSPLALPTTGEPAGRKISAAFSLMAAAMRSAWILSILASSAFCASSNTSGLLSRKSLIDGLDLLALGRAEAAFGTAAVLCGAGWPAAVVGRRFGLWRPRRRRGRSLVLPDGERGPTSRMAGASSARALLRGQGVDNCGEASFTTPVVHSAWPAAGLAQVGGAL